MTLKYLLQKKQCFISRLQTDLELPSPKSLGNCSKSSNEDQVKAEKKAYN